jgi:hypothetical protein
MYRDKPAIPAITRDRRDSAVGSADLPHVEVGGMNPHRRRKRIEESYRQVCESLAEFRPVRPVPGDDLVERL